MSQNHVIFDCDGGSDDAWALILLLKAHQQKLVNLVGVTITGNGNTTLQYAAINMFRILKAFNYLEKIPVFLGSEESILTRGHIKEKHMFHGVDGFGDVLPPDETINPKELVQKTHAVTAIKQFVEQNPKNTSIVCVGPCTNLALCYLMYGCLFSEQIKEVYLMGGNIRGVGNTTRSAEFNFYADPEAAHIVLTKTLCPLTILPWETCIGDSFNLDLDWRLRNFDHSHPAHPVLNFLDVVELSQYRKYGFPNWIPCDSIAAAAFLNPSMVTCTDWHAVVDLRGEYTRGQMVLDHLQDEKNPKNVKVIEKVNEQLFKQMVIWSLGYVEDFHK